MRMFVRVTTVVSELQLRDTTPWHRLWSDENYGEDLVVEVKVTSFPAVPESWLRRPKGSPLKSLSLGTKFQMI